MPLTVLTVEPSAKEKKTTCMTPPLAPDTSPSLGTIRLVLNSDIMLNTPVNVSTF